MDVLIVGAGAVGVSYADVLARAGARVSFYVRPPRVAEVQGGVQLLDVGLLRKPRARTVTPHAVLSSPDEVAAQSFDQVWLTVPSNALEQSWLPALCEAAPKATFVMWQPGLDDRLRVESLTSPERVVTGVIVLVAWHAPLPSESLPVGVASWFPPMLATPISGDQAASVQAAFKRGGVRCRVVPDASAASAPVSALLQMLIASLECEGWSLRALLSGQRAALALRAARQAMVIAAAATDQRPPRAPGMLRPWMLRSVRPFLPLAFPTDLEIYLRAHFTKVGVQTARAIDSYLARAGDLPSDAIREVRDALAAAREEASS